MDKLVAELQQELEHSENMRSFDRNMYQKLLAEQWSGIAQTMYDSIHLELEAMHDLTEYLSEDDKRRFVRRLNRIEAYLQDFIHNK